MRITVVILAVATTLLLSPPVRADEARLAEVVRFTDYDAGPVEDWLQSKGFQFESDARRRNYIDLDVDEEGLDVEARRPAMGILPNESVNVPDFSTVEIDWGVRKFPEGASYEKGVRNEALMVVFFLGDERQPSGSMFIPDSPYFVGVFLCQGNDRTNHPYVGAYFKKSGRYVCLDRPATGARVTTRFDLMAAYRAYFDKEGDDDPAVSGIALMLDTKKAGDGGQSSAFLREIRFYR